MTSRGVYKVLSIDPEVLVSRKTSKTFENFQIVEKTIKEDRYQLGRATDGAGAGTGELIVYSFHCAPDAIHAGDLISAEPNACFLHEVYLLAKLS